MQQLSDWYFALVFSVTMLGFLVAGILFFSNRSDSFSSRLLAGFLVSISIVALNNELMATTFFLRFPHFWRVVVAASFCVPAFSYLYVRSVLEQSYRLRKYDWLLFVPAVLYTISLVPFYLLPVEKKMEIISSTFSNLSLISQEREGILPAGWGIMSRVFLGLAATTAQFILLARWKKTIFGDEERLKQNRLTYRWLFLFSIIVGAMYVLLLVLIPFHIANYFSAWHQIIFTITGTILFISIYLLLRPAILYGITGWFQLPELRQPNSEEQILVNNQPQGENKKATLSLEQGITFKSILENHFKQNHPYRKGGYSMSDLSKELSIPAHQLSAFINQEYGKNFNELVNDNRVDYLAELLKSSPEYFQYTLEALGKLAGFNSRAAFIAAVKKKTGLTPSEFYGKKPERITN